MAKNLRTALLTTAVASGLLFSSAPVEAQILEGKAETTQGDVTEGIQEPTVPAAETKDEEPSPAAAPDSVLLLRRTRKRMASSPFKTKSRSMPSRLPRAAIRHRSRLKH
ncbi:hypothetical protein GCM10009715_37510 [Paeniglutamicibacter psychrophenolicus]|uniref:Uncharacterized protein n=1 Tax=Paeniglutamicibacter psychrophenolicus TaxID=257454 RepID=A0ABS4W850_9MICC|nr:hypothetical protein [Paeniglutamicibacter psychrophenolicus]MBP2372355.1 hypothetical protein [Paeniglutamicibacter psychrophenolicus]